MDYLADNVQLVIAIFKLFLFLVFLINSTTNSNLSLAIFYKSLPPKKDGRLSKLFT